LIEATLLVGAIISSETQMGNAIGSIPTAATVAPDFIEYPMG
jgi:hypothetical protein